MLSRVIIISGLHADLTEDNLYDLFDAYGCIEDVQLFVDERDGRSLGYGEVVYASMDCALRALEASDGLEIWGSTLMVRASSYFEEGQTAEEAYQDAAKAAHLPEGDPFLSGGFDEEAEPEEEFRFVSEITYPLWVREALLDDERESA